MSYLLDFCSASLSVFISSSLLLSLHTAVHPSIYLPNLFCISVCVTSRHVNVSVTLKRLAPKSKKVSSSCHYCSRPAFRPHLPNPLRASGFLLHSSRISPISSHSHQYSVRKLSLRCFLQAAGDCALVGPTEPHFWLQRTSLLRLVDYHVQGLRS